MRPVSLVGLHRHPLFGVINDAKSLSWLFYTYTILDSLLSTMAFNGTQCVGCVVG